jgi:hypothetical protein
VVVVVVAVIAIELEADWIRMVQGLAGSTRWNRSNDNGGFKHLGGQSVGACQQYCRRDRICRLLCANSSVTRLGQLG